MLLFHLLYKKHIRDHFAVEHRSWKVFFFHLFRGTCTFVLTRTYSIRFVSIIYEITVIVAFHATFNTIIHSRLQLNFLTKSIILSATHAILNTCKLSEIIVQTHSRLCSFLTKNDNVLTKSQMWRATSVLLNDLSRPILSSIICRYLKH